MQSVKPLSADELYTRCDPRLFDFETTADLEALTEPLGQERAVDAIQFGTEIQAKGYNLYVLGQQGSGRHTAIRRILTARSATSRRADDWCYVNNFQDPTKPRALRLPPGEGTVLRDDIGQLIDEAHTALTAAFESNEYHTRHHAIEEELQEYQENTFERLQDYAKQRRIKVIQTSTGVVFAPTRDDKTISSEEFKKLPKDEQERIDAMIREVTAEFQRIMQSIPEEARKTRGKLRELDREVSTLAVGSLINQLIEKYLSLPRIVAYLRDLQADIVENVEIFLKGSSGEATTAISLLGGRGIGPDRGESPAMRRYAVNVLVSNSGEEGAPVVFENHPTFPNLIGKIEHMSEMGTLVTNFTLIKSGALHRANGGYLVIDTAKLLVQPFAWEGLKRALKSREIRTQSLGEALSLVSTVSLEPEPIPLETKVFLVGDRLLYYLLQVYDPEFTELFKVAADFEDEFDRTPDNSRLFARLLSMIASREKLRPLDRAATARLIEACVREAGDAEKISASLMNATDLVRESDYHAARNGRHVIASDDVQEALDARTRRASRVRDRLQEEILRGTLLIDTAGEVTGQVNGLAIAQLGEFAFAHPSRITARVALGSGEVVDIEREVELGGPLHSKGVLILSGYLASRYVIDRPLSLSASLVFEQTYSGVEGDSASAAELCALLSALSGAPLRQDLAITGSVNQHGRIQAIGGVNEKIEGFFDICNRRGLSGTQGVLIPAANVKHLMLRNDVVDAVREGNFSVYPVEDIDQCMTLLTGREAGAAGEDGQFAEGTVNAQVRDRLLAFADQRHAFGASDKSDSS
ncbi:MAG: ATP-dependent protease [Gammaproteobacteria bacterium SG8_30]|nr:MAG: ATP-dependent protease [Gammaproteobacteria bacterium SG8_30]